MTDGITFGPYRAIERLGRGGMGVVFLGESESGRRVAIKSLDAVKGSNPGRLRALRREVELLKTLDHPHIVGVLDSDLSGERPWYAMEHVEGPSLAKLLTDDPSHSETIVDTPLETVKTPLGAESPSRVRGRGVAGWDSLTRASLGWLAQIGHALAYMHGEGLIHGDLKPHNIVVSGQRAVLIDFGLADQIEGRITLAGLRRAQSSAHTPGYASPECLRAERLDPRTDLYSLGCMIFEAVTGRLPFEGSPMLVMVAHLKKDPPPLSSLVDEVPAELERLVARLLSKERHERSAHALDVVSTLESIGVVVPEEGRLPSVEPYLYPAPVVGRDREIESIVDRMGVVETKPGTILITGETGVGKSTLTLRAIKAASEHEYRIVVTSGTTLGSGPATDDSTPPFAAFSGVFDDIVDFARTAPPREASAVLDSDALVLAPFEPRLEAWCDREAPVLKDPIGAACRSLRRVLTRMCELKGLVLVCDEIQWFDPASMQALRQLMEHAHDQPWLVLGLVRSDDFDLEAHGFLTRDAEVMELSSLAIEDTGRSVAGILGLRDVDAGVAELVHRRCDGNPYTIREFMNVALAEGALTLSGSGAWTGPRGGSLADSLAAVSEPESVVELTRRRLAALDSTALGVAEHAAVIGRQFSLWLLASAVPALAGEGLDHALNRLRTRDVVESTLDPMTMRFTHDRLRETLLASLSDDLRSDIHLAVARAMEETGHDAAITAWHYEEAGEPSQATTQWLKAVEEARTQQMPRRLATLLANVIRTGENVLSSAELHRLRVDRVEALTNCEDHPSALEEGAALLHTEELSDAIRGRLLALIARSQCRTGEVDVSLQTIDEALDLLGKESEPDRYAAALATRGDILDILRRQDEALRAYDHSLALAEEHDLLELRTRLLNNVGLLYRSRGDYENAARLISAAVESARETSDRWREGLLVSNLGWIYSDQGHYDAALAEYARSLELAEELEDAHALALNQGRLGIVHLHRSDYREALRCFGLTKGHYQRAGMKGALGYIFIYEAIAHLHQGRFDRAEALTRRGLALVEGTFISDELHGLHTLGSIHRHAEQWADARSTLQRGLRMAEEADDGAAVILLLSELSLLCSYQGDADEALELARRCMEKAEETGSEEFVVEARLTEGVALHRSGRAEEALQKLTSAYGSLCQQQRRWLAALAATEAAHAAHAVDTKTATEWLERASKILADLDIEPTSLAHRAYVHARDLIAS